MIGPTSASGIAGCPPSVRNVRPCPLSANSFGKALGFQHNEPQPMTQPWFSSSKLEFSLLSSLCIAFADHRPLFWVENDPESCLLISHGHQPSLAPDATFDVTSFCYLLIPPPSFCMTSGPLDSSKDTILGSFMFSLGLSPIAP